MKKLIGIALAVAFTAVLAVGCKRKPKEYTYDVYVAGVERLRGGGNRALLWNKDQFTRLSEEESRAYSVCASGSDVYVAGSGVKGRDFVAALWKNSKPEVLTDASIGSDASYVFVSGDDVYVAGYEERGGKYCAMLWKNDKPTRLSDRRATRAEARSVFVIDNDVYVAGYEMHGGKNKMMLWKNGEPVQSLIDAAPEATASSVYVVKREKE